MSITTPSQDLQAPGRQKAQPVLELSKKRSNKHGKSKSKFKQGGKKATGVELNVAPTPNQAWHSTGPPATLVKPDRVHLPSDSQAYSITSPKHPNPNQNCVKAGASLKPG